MSASRISFEEWREAQMADLRSRDDNAVHRAAAAAFAPFAINRKAAK